MVNLADNILANVCVILRSVYLEYFGELKSFCQICKKFSPAKILYHTVLRSGVVILHHFQTCSAVIQYYK